MASFTDFIEGVGNTVGSTLESVSNAGQSLVSGANSLLDIISPSKDNTAAATQTTGTTKLPTPAPAVSTNYTPWIIGGVALVAVIFLLKK